MLQLGYIPQRQVDGCKKTAAFNDYRCLAYPEFHSCNLEAPSTCIAEWVHPHGYRFVIIVQGYSMLTFRQSGRPL